MKKCSTNEHTQRQHDEARPRGEPDGGLRAQQWESSTVCTELRTHSTTNKIHTRRPKRPPHITSHAHAQHLSKGEMPAKATLKEIRE